MKDNKLDIMCNKVGGMIMELEATNVIVKSQIVANVVKALRVLQEDFEVLRKCTLDNPDYKWEDNTDPSQGGGA